MSASRRSTVRSSTAPLSDMARVDAHVIQQHEYDEAPDLSDRDMSEDVLEVAGKPMRGRPALGDKAKRQVTLRLDPDVIEAFKASGAGWQGRMNAVLRKGLRSLR